MGVLTPGQVAAWVERTCAEQGVPVRVTDPETVRQVGVLLGARRRRGERSAPLQPPERPDPVAVEGPPPAGGWTDDGVVQDGHHDRGLPGEVQRRPRVA